jgi:hypothetical protein
MDSGATDHITSDLEKLTIHDKYHGEHVHAANGSGMKISHVGYSTLHTQKSKIHLRQTERVNAVLKNMLRACVLSSRGLWESWLPLAEFAYNNSYQESIKMTPFEAMYGRKYRTPFNWVEPEERRFYEIDFVEEAEKKVNIIQQNMQAAQSRQKNYANKRRRPLEFQVGDYVYLKVTPMKNKRFGIKKKLAARFVGPYRIIEKKGPVAYKLQLPEAMSSIFSVFHVSQLKKCLRVPEERIEPHGIRIKADLEYREQLVRVLDTKDRVTRNKVVTTYKIQWSHHDESDRRGKQENIYKPLIKIFTTSGS